MRSIVLAGLLCLSPAAHAGPGTALPTLFGSLVGGAAGALVGAPIYGAIDPYQSDDAAEWLLVGAPIGFGIGAAVGGSVTHTLFGGKPLSVALVTGGLAIGSTVLVGMTPRLYDDFADDRFAAAWVTGTAIAVAGIPVAATLTSLFTGSRKEAPALAFLPTGRGLMVTGRL